VGVVHAQPVAIVTDVAGNARLEFGDESRSVNVLDNLEAGTSISIGEASNMTLVYLDSGVEYKMEGPTSFVAGTTAPEAVQGEQAQARTLKLLEETGLKPAEGNLNQAAIVFRNVHTFGGKVELLGPMDTKLMTSAPLFKWEPLGEGTRYLFELKSSRDRLLYTYESSATELRVPAEIKLGNGRKYRWTVSAKLGNEPYSGTASFQMGSQREIEKLVAYRPALDAPFSEKIVYALVLRQQGFNHAAKQNWDRLVRERPDDPAMNSLWGQESSAE
ncbi:MAG: hypothetical protein KJP04_00995, partial [Arenicella sp.]|nr:hypothetical protein [Arenicella sp.]